MKERLASDKKNKKLSHSLLRYVKFEYVELQIRFECWCGGEYILQL